MRHVRIRIIRPNRYRGRALVQIDDVEADLGRDRRSALKQKRVRVSAVDLEVRVERADRAIPKLLQIQRALQAEGSVRCVARHLRNSDGAAEAATIDPRVRIESVYSPWRFACAGMAEKVLAATKEAPDIENAVRSRDR